MSVSHEIMLLDSTQKLPEHTTFDLFLEISGWQQYHVR